MHMCQHDCMAQENHLRVGRLPPHRNRCVPLGYKRIESYVLLSKYLIHAEEPNQIPTIIKRSISSDISDVWITFARRAKRSNQYLKVENVICSHSNNAKVQEWILCNF